MKTIPILLAADYEKTVTSICTCLKVTRSDSVVVGFTELDRPVTVDGVDYLPGFNVSSLSSTETLGVDNMQLTIIPDDVLPRSDLLKGLWNNAAFEVFEVNYETPSNGINVLKNGSTGELNLYRSKFVVEFRGRNQLLQQTQGITTSKTCRARLGDDKCTKDLTAFTDTGALTIINSALDFYDEVNFTRLEDFFSEGLLTMTNGNAAGQTRKIKSMPMGSYNGITRFILALPFIPAPAVGDTYIAVAGCRHRKAEDCIGKFNNVLNFQGEDEIPNLDAITKPGSAA